MFVFWDQLCLNFGQNWQEGFLLGLQNSSVIVLLISSQVNFFLFLFFLSPTFSFFLFYHTLDGIRSHATSKQDNVLLEYPLFLINLNFYSGNILLQYQSMNLHCFSAFHVAHLSCLFLLGSIKPHKKEDKDKQKLEFERFNSGT